MLHYQESDYAEKIRYYSPGLTNLSKEVVIDSPLVVSNWLSKIREQNKIDADFYQMSKKAYTSMLRA